PSGVRAAAQSWPPAIGPIGGRSTRSGAPLAMSQTRIVLSCDTLINCFPSRVNSTFHTVAVCPPESSTRIGFSGVSAARATEEKASPSSKGPSCRMVNLVEDCQGRDREGQGPGVVSSVDCWPPVDLWCAKGTFLIALVNCTIQANRISADWASCHIN